VFHRAGLAQGQTAPPHRLRLTSRKSPGAKCAMLLAAKGEKTMQETSLADRHKELRDLLDKLEAHPERAYPQERARVAVLQKLLAAHEKARA